jgi:hypothetical protein
MTKVYVFMIQRKVDREAWPTVYADRDLAEKAFGRVTPVQEVTIGSADEPEVGPLRHFVEWAAGAKCDDEYAARMVRHIATVAKDVLEGVRATQQPEAVKVMTICPHGVYPVERCGPCAANTDIIKAARELLDFGHPEYTPEDALHVEAWHRLNALVERPAPPPETVCADLIGNQHPTNRYLFKRMCTFFCVELGEDDVRTALAKIDAVAAQPSCAATFQDRALTWMRGCFLRPDAMLLQQRSFRFVEEALELSQATGTSKQDVMRLVEYTYSRPTGTIMQEIGGVMVTLSGLASAAGESLKHCAETELQRCIDNTEKIRAKDLAKPERSPLPGSTPQTKEAGNG